MMSTTVTQIGRTKRRQERAQAANRQAALWCALLTCSAWLAGHRQSVTDESLILATRTVHFSGRGH